ncbi:TetR/AcrR family transcriptional regulator [Variovorax paradoxus]|uniref:TetR/AcrR family transcriptional regulator n=1 Tax=Variovorax paradoxus TaxID=34073 RepID=UPI001ABC1D8B
MGYSQAEKSRSRERILAQAAEQIRADGLESLSVGKLMKSAGLTHGGFYGHFASRSELLVHAVEQALVAGQGAFEQSRPKGEPGYADTVRSYLSRKHRDSRSSGCAMAALAGDVARADAEVRAPMAEHIESFVDAMALAMGDDDRDKATFAVAAMIGAVIVSRVITDPKRSDEVLAVAKRELLALPGAKED